MELASSGWAGSDWVGPSKWKVSRSQPCRLGSEFQMADRVRCWLSVERKGMMAGRSARGPLGPMSEGPAALALKPAVVMAGVTAIAAVVTKVKMTTVQ